jgi:hypothetical protein
MEHCLLIIEKGGSKYSHLLVKSNVVANALKTDVVANNPRKFTKKD